MPYTSDLGRVIGVLRRIAAEQHESALIGVEELGDAAIKLRFQAGVPAAEADTAKLSLNLAIRQQLAAAGIQFMQEAAQPLYGPSPPRSLRHTPKFRDRKINQGGNRPFSRRVASRM